MSDLMKCDGCGTWGSRKRQHITPEGWRFLRLLDTDAANNQFYIVACSPECVAKISGAWEAGPARLDGPAPAGALAHASIRMGHPSAEEVEALRDGVVQAADALIAALEAQPKAPAAGPDPVLKPTSTALDVECPYCHAAKGDPCQERIGRDLPHPTVHVARAVPPPEAPK